MENFALFIGIDLGKREFYAAFRYQSHTCKRGQI